MADSRVTIRFQFDFTDAIRQLREAADALEAVQRADDRDVVDQHMDPDIIGDTKGG